MIAVVVIALVVGAVLLVSGGEDEASATEVYTEPISTPGADPFAPAVGTDEQIPAVQANGTYEGNHVGLYGGTLNQSSCDKQQLVVFLQQNPDKAAAWAGVVGISTTQISTYIAGLTPVILRSDTLVTNHGYANGQATVIPAVLQAGTAVLIDDKGFPVTKCYCGNPLTPPTFYTPQWQPRYSGPTWPGFSGTSITIIQSTTVIIDTFVLVDPRTRQPFDRPRGTDGAQDTPVNPPSTTTTTAPPTTTLTPTDDARAADDHPAAADDHVAAHHDDAGRPDTRAAGDRQAEPGRGPVLPVPGSHPAGVRPEHGEHQRFRADVRAHGRDAQHGRLAAADLHLERRPRHLEVHADQRPRDSREQLLRVAELTIGPSATSGSATR